MTSPGARELSGLTGSGQYSLPFGALFIGSHQLQIAFVEHLSALAPLHCSSKALFCLFQYRYTRLHYIFILCNVG